MTITQLRQDLFRLMDRALKGERIEFSHRGTVFQIVPEAAPDKLAKLTKQTVVAPALEAAQADKELLQEMEAEWEQDWAEL